MHYGGPWGQNTTFQKHNKILQVNKDVNYPGFRNIYILAV